MNVSMDGLRWQLINNYNSLVKRLNNTILNGEVRIDCEDIQKQLDNIRECIVTLAYIRLEGEFEYIEDANFEEFNPNEGEDCFKVN